MNQNPGQYHNSCRRGDQEPNGNPSADAWASWRLGPPGGVRDLPGEKYAHPEQQTSTKAGRSKDHQTVSPAQQHLEAQAGKQVAECDTIQRKGHG
eukprot:gene9640-biopygen21251